MEARFTNLIIYGGILLVVAVGAALAGTLFGPKKKGITKSSPYECGSPLLQATRSRFDVRFFMLALVFILFDIETVLLLPYVIQHHDWLQLALQYKEEVQQSGSLIEREFALERYEYFKGNFISGLIIMGVFFLGLVESLLYAWKKGALDWK